VAAFHVDAEREGRAEVELAGDELYDYAGKEDAVEGEEGLERGARAVEEKPEEERKCDGDERGFGAGEKEEQADGARECGGYAASSPEEGEADEEAAERGGEHGFHAVELVALKQRGGEEWNSDEGEGAQRAA
jgi:hypothetical protein